MTSAAKKYLSYSLKIAIVLLALFYVYHRVLTSHDDLERFRQLTAKLDYTEVIITLGIIVLLMLVNWVVESLKWRYLTKKLSQITIWIAIQAVFCGLTWAIFTPNRFGEYGGRVMFLPNRKRIYGVFAMAVGSFGQNVVTNVLGSVSLLWFVYIYLSPSGWLFALLLIAMSAFAICFLLFFFNIKWLVRLLNRVSFLHKYHRFFDIMGRYRFKELLSIMWFCMARFAAFTLQYFLLIHLLIPQIPVFSFFMIMPLFFFIQSAIPSLDLLDIGVRSITADKLFSYITDQHIAIVASVSIIYLINIIIPAIFGSVFVFNLKFFDRNS